MLKESTKFFKSFFVNIHTNAWLCLKPIWHKGKRLRHNDSVYANTLGISAFLAAANLLPIIVFLEREQRAPLSIVYLTFTCLSFYLFTTTSSALKLFKWKDQNKESIGFKVGNYLSWIYLISIPIMMLVFGITIY